MDYFQFWLLNLEACHTMLKSYPEWQRDWPGEATATALTDSDPKRPGANSFPIRSGKIRSSGRADPSYLFIHVSSLDQVRLRR